MENIIKTFLLSAFAFSFLYAGCRNNMETPAPTVKDAGKKAEYIKIAPEKASDMINRGDAVILDVRNRDEYNEAHISGAILLPVDDIKLLAPTILPDKAAVILVHCRSGKRSERAARMLLEMGYSSVYDFGGIQDWPYGVVTGK